MANTQNNVDCCVCSESLLCFLLAAAVTRANEQSGKGQQAGLPSNGMRVTPGSRPRECLEETPPARAGLAKAGAVWGRTPTKTVVHGRECSESRQEQAILEPTVRGEEATTGRPLSSLLEQRGRKSACNRWIYCFESPGPWGPGPEMVRCWWKTPPARGLAGRRSGGREREGEEREQDTHTGLFPCCCVPLSSALLCSPTPPTTTKNQAVSR